MVMGTGKPMWLKLDKNSYIFCSCEFIIGKNQDPVSFDRMVSNFLIQAGLEV